MYNKSNMVYKDYKWVAKADHDNPKIIYGNDAERLNRMEGYEMLYFIRSFAKTLKWSDNDIEKCQKIEKEIREELPGDVQSHAAVLHWLTNPFRF